MHRAAFFASGRGGAGQRKTFLGWGRAGQGVKSSGRGGVTVNLGAFSGWGGAVLNIFEAGAAIFHGARAGRGGAGRTSLENIQSVHIIISCS